MLLSRVLVAGNCKKKKKCGNRLDMLCMLDPPAFCVNHSINVGGVLPVGCVPASALLMTPDRCSAVRFRATAEITDSNRDAQEQRGGEPEVGPVTNTIPADSLFISSKPMRPMKTSQIKPPRAKQTPAGTRRAGTAFWSPS